MNSSDAPCFFPPCGSYEPQQWGWPRQDVGYPYYSESPLQPLTHQTLPIPPPDSSSSGGPVGSCGPGGGGGGGTGGGGCSTSSTDCRIPKSHQGGGGGGGGYMENNGRQSVKDEPGTNDHSNDRDEDLSGPHSSMKQEATSSDCNNSKKKRDRFNGMTEEDVLKKTVPDLLSPNLDIIIIGSCPGLTAAYLGHHYAGPGNHFWKCLYLAGLIPEPMNACDDYKLKQYGIGFTNFIARCSKGSVEFSRREIKEGVECLTEKIQAFKPKIAVFNGKGIYEVFCNHKNFYIGKQPEPFPGTNTVVYVMPSSSARCSQLPRASDKVPFFVALRKLRDHLRGCLPHLDESEIVFPDLDLKVEPRKDRRPVEDGRSAAVGGGGSSSGALGGQSESMSGVGGGSGGGGGGGGGGGSSSSSSSAAAAAEKDRKRRHLDCNYNPVEAAMSSNERLYRSSGLPPSFAAAMDMPQDFKSWSAGLQKWPPSLGGHFTGHPNPLVSAAMGGGRADCTYDTMMLKQQQDADQSRAGLLRSISSGAPFYAPGWPDAAAAAAQHRWTMHGLANRFSNEARSGMGGMGYPPIPAYLQYPDMIACDRLSGHLAAQDARAASMYPSLYNPGGFQPSDSAAAAAAAASAFSYNSSLSHDMKAAAASQLDPSGFLQRPSYSPPSYYPQYR